MASGAPGSGRSRAGRWRSTCGAREPRPLGASAQRRAAITDGLTGLRSRRFFEQALQSESTRATRTGHPVSMLLPGAGPEQACEIAERIRQGIAAVPIAVNPGRLHPVTVSIGAAFLPVAGADTQSLVLFADRALYAARNAGRNQVAAADDALVEAMAPA